MDGIGRFRRFVERFVPLGAEEWGLIRPYLIEKTFDAGEVILQNGDVCDNLLFVSDGLARASVVTPNGKDQTWSLAYYHPEAHVTHLFAVDYYSFLQRTPSHVLIEAVEPCQCVSLDHDAVLGLYEQSASFNTFGRVMAQEAYSFVHRFLIELRTLSIRERYQRFLQEYDAIVDRIPQYLIASYLGITPQYLSILRSGLR